MTSVMLVEIKSFLHKKSVISSDRVIFEFSKYAEAEPAVKVRSLKRECVQPDTLAAFLTRQRFHLVHQLCAQPLPSGYFRDYQQLNK